MNSDLIGDNQIGLTSLTRTPVRLGDRVPGVWSGRPHWVALGRGVGLAAGFTGVGGEGRPAGPPAGFGPLGLEK
jgi:hypothetical protein